LGTHEPDQPWTEQRSFIVVHDSEDHVSGIERYICQRLYDLLYLYERELGSLPVLDEQLECILWQPSDGLPVVHFIGGGRLLVCLRS